MDRTVLGRTGILLEKAVNSGFPQPLAPARGWPWPKARGRFPDSPTTSLFGARAEPAPGRTLHWLIGKELLVRENRCFGFSRPQSLPLRY